MAAVPLRQISGRFYRAIRPELIEHVLAPPLPEHQGRYHAPGQPALYMSPRAEWAANAGEFNTRSDGASRIVVELEVSAACVLDQHDEAACLALGIDRERSNASWRKCLAAGQRPPSWDNADAARATGADGIIDRSRLIPGGWHVVLFRWNELGGPNVRVDTNKR